MGGAINAPPENRVVSQRQRSGDKLAFIRIGILPIVEDKGPAECQQNNQHGGAEYDWVMPPCFCAWKANGNKSQHRRESKCTPCHQPIVRRRCVEPCQQVELHSSWTLGASTKTVKAVSTLGQTHCRSNLAFRVVALKLLRGRKIKVKNGSVDLPEEVP